MTHRIAFLLLLAAVALPAADLSGDWPGTLQTAMGVDTHNLTLKQAGSAITGTVSFSNRKWEIHNGKLEGRKLKFEVSLSGSNPMVLAYDLDVGTDQMTGTVMANQGPFPGGKVTFRRAH